MRCMCTCMWYASAVYKGEAETSLKVLAARFNEILPTTHLQLKDSFPSALDVAWEHAWASASPLVPVLPILTN